MSDVHVLTTASGCHIFSGCGYPAPSIENFYFKPIFTVGGIAITKPVVLAVLSGGQAFVSHAVYLGLDEGVLKPLLDRVVASFDDVSVGSYPRWRDPSCKTQVTFEYEDGRPVRLKTVLISTQHGPDIDLETLLKPDLRDHVIAPLVPDAARPCWPTTLTCGCRRPRSRRRQQARCRKPGARFQGRWRTRGMTGCRCRAPF